MRRSYLFILFFLLVQSGVVAADVFVKGYTRKDGTYVRPHIRSAPDSSRANNYGPSRSDYQLLMPRQRDNDRDGTANYLDIDDDNDSIMDDLDRSQYGGSNKRHRLLDD